MFQKYFVIITLLYVTIRITNATPVPYPAQYSRAFNQQSFATPNDINDLEEDHVKRALSDVSMTIKEVQKLLETDPTLPRLTRGEIEELFENVTKQEYEKSLRKGDRDRAKHMRALMLVLPYNTNNNSDLQELYTRPPVTRVVNSEIKLQKIQKIVVQPEDIDTSEKNATTYKPTLQIRPESQRPAAQRPAAQRPAAQRPATQRPYAQRPDTPQPDTQRPTTFHPKSPKIPYPNVQPSPNPLATTVIPVRNAISSHYAADKPPAPFKVQTPIRENVKDLLATIGLTQELIPTTTAKPELTAELKELLQSFGLLTNEQPPNHIVNIEPIQEEFEPIVEPIASSLIRHQHTVIDEFKPIPTQIRSNYRMNTAPELTSYDFQAFKPLPIPEEGPVSSDMEEFLKSFGLFDGNARGKKSMNIEDDDDRKAESSEVVSSTAKPEFVKMDKMPEVSVDFLAPGLMSVLENIGITNGNTNRGKYFERGLNKYDDESASNHRRSDENISISADDDQNDDRISESVNDVTMRMLKNQTVTEEDFAKLQQLLETIKKLDKLNANLTDEELESLNLSNFNLSESLLTHGLNPIDNVEFDITKNELKRQAEVTSETSNPLRFTLDLQATTEEFHDKEDILNKTSAETTTTTSVDTTEEMTSTTTTTTTEEPRRSDLDDSFGGLDPVAEEPLPAPRRNGFYFLADWNSFLEVGEDPDKVIVRFDPKVGDPSRFLPVTVP